MPAMDFEVNIDLHNNEIKNVLIDNVSGDPSGTPGQIIYNTTEHVLKYYDQGSWVTLAQGGSLTGYQLRSEKGQADGYVGLNSNSKIENTFLNTGNASGMIPVLNGAIADGQVIQYSASSGGFVSRSLSGVYTYKDSVTFANLPSSGQVIGDVYNVTDQFTLDDQVYPAGTNVAWNGTGWDALGGTVDLSGYQTISNIVQNLSSPSTGTYPSTQAVATALAAKQDTISLTADRAVVSSSAGALQASAVTATELGYLSGVSSAIQTQINGKQDTITGAATTITSADLTTDRALISNASGKVAVSTVTSTELGYLSGVSSAIQTQINGINTNLDGKVDALETSATAGTYTKVTINADGLVESGQAQIAVADISDLSTTLANYIPTSQRGAASGVATLDGNSHVTFSQIPGGNTANSVVTIATPGTAGQAVVVNESADGFAFANLLERSTGTITGNGTSTSFPIEHGLRGPPVGYVIVNDTTHKAIQAEVTYTNDTTITVAFNTAPANGVTYSVYMVG